MGLTESLFQKFQSGAIMADPGRYSGKVRKGTTFTPGQKLSLIRHVLSVASRKNICRPVNANGSVGGQNNSFTDAMGGFLACLGSVCHFSDNFRKRFHLRNSFHPKPLKIPIENSPAASCSRPIAPAPLDLLLPSGCSELRHRSPD